jgi:drug/metabolite transporter (DMT)-like permease
MDINSFVAGLYDPWFNYDLYRELQDAVYNAFDFQKLGISLIIVSIIFLLIFYKFWDPVKKPRFKWFLTLLLVGVIMYIITNGLMYNNVEILEFIGLGHVPNPHYFIFQLAAISLLYGMLLSAVLSIFIKYFSVSNKKNPF